MRESDIEIERAIKCKRIERCATKREKRETGALVEHVSVATNESEQALVLSESSLPY